jgi:hypothetical protein
MVKLTPDLVLGAAQYLNPCRDRELDLRGESVLEEIRVGDLI